MQRNPPAAVGVRVLVVEDDQAQLRTLSRILRDEGFEVIPHATAAEALKCLAHDHIDAAVVDLRLPDIDEMCLLDKLGGQAERIPIIINTGHGSYASARKAVNRGFFAFVEKDTAPAELVSHVRRAIETRLRRRAEESEAAVAERTRELREANDALLASERRYRSTLDNMMEGCQLIGSDWRYLYVNDAAARHGRQTKEDLLGRTLTEAYPGIDKTDLFDVMRRCMEERKAYQIENEFPYSDGSKAWFDLHIEPAPEGIFVLSIEITERKRAEEALRREKAFVDSAIDGIQDVFYVFDLSGKFLRWNRRACEVTGYKDEAVAEMKPSDFFDGEDQRRVLGAIETTVQRGETCLEVDFLTKDGTRIPYELTGSVLRDLQGKVVGVCGCGRDITERKRAEKELRESELKYRTLFDSVLDAVFMHEVTEEGMPGPFLEFNQAACDRLGYTREELRQLTPVSLDVPEVIEELAPIVMSEVLAKGFAIFESVQRAKDGRRIPVENSTRLVVEGHRRRLFTVCRDVSDRKRAEEQLARAKDAAEAANRAKSEFLANVSHEIRTPMAAITGFTELLLSKVRSPEEQRDYLTTIHRNAESLLAIINDILDLSKIEAEKISLELVDCSPREVVEEVKMLLSDRAGEKKLWLEVQYEESTPTTIRTDPGKVRQILINLVSNAIKFTDHGGVRITVRWLPGKGAEAGMRIEVTDTGIGISAEGMEKMFEPFTQVDMSPTRRYGGTGLGLSISQRLAEMLGGRIDAASEPGKGSTFTLAFAAELPGEQCVQETPREAQLPGAENTRGSYQGRVLLAEDSADMAKLMQRTLEQSGLELELAENGRAACEKALASRAADAPYDLILMDIRMPVMDGYEATRRLRAAGWKEPIIALTANSMRGDREKCLAAGCDDFLAKPVGQAAFFDLLDRYLEARPTTVETEPQSADSRKAPAEARLFDGLLDVATTDQMLKEYSETLLVKAEALAKAIAAHDLELVSGVAHELKGVAGMYGFTRISEKASTLQSLAGGKDPLAQVDATVRELIELCRTSAQAGRHGSGRGREEANDR